MAVPLPPVGAGKAASAAAGAASKATKAAGAAKAATTAKSGVDAAKTGATAARAAGAAKPQMMPRTPKAQQMPQRTPGAPSAPGQPRTPATPGRRVPGTTRSPIGQQQQSVGQTVKDSARAQVQQGSDGEKLGAGKRVLGTVGDVAKSTAVGAVQGAVVGGGAPGAIAGAGKGALQGLTMSRHTRPIILALLLVLLLPTVVYSAFATALTVNIAASLTSADQTTSGAAARESGNTDNDIQYARDLVAGTNIPWEVALSVSMELGADLDIDVMRAALDAEDQFGRYRNIGAGAVYSSGSATREIGTDPEAKAAAEKVEAVWSAALVTATGTDEPTAHSIFQRARVWYLGQSFGQCGVELANAGDSDVELDEEQSGNAATIIGIAKSAFTDIAQQRTAAVIGIATAMQESSLRNLQGGDRDSIGLFQQRPSAGWGTVEQIMDPAYAAGRFFKALSQVDKWDLIAITDAAQAVQISGFPDAYAKWEALARATVGTLFADTQPIAIPDAVGYVPPAEGSEPEGAVLCIGNQLIINGDTSLPVVHYVVFDRFGPRAAPLPGASTWHRGIDMSIGGCLNNPPHREPIYSIQAGTVVRAGWWDAYGYAVEVDHGNGFHTRYAHMMEGSLIVQKDQTVRAGQQIGDMGTTGMSTGCHLHFETLINGKKENPEIIMLRLGVPL